FAMGTHQNRPVSRVNAPPLDVSRYFREKRIRKVGNQNSDGLGRPAVLINRKDVRTVIILFQSLLNTIARRFANTRVVVEVFRNRRPGDAAQRCEFFHGSDFLTHKVDPHPALGMQFEAKNTLRDY
ncbi:MAG: hypothetical protein MI741_03940, partial [Rhodospirillales bacterium]|nr:hypothetical protein [Rhodospirillales bacterium]